SARGVPAGRAGGGGTDPHPPRRAAYGRRVRTLARRRCGRRFGLVPGPAALTCAPGPGGGQAHRYAPRTWRAGRRLRWVAAGEGLGGAVGGVLEGLAAGGAVTAQRIAGALARRRLGYGRGARMKFEQDQGRMLGGVRHGLTMGGPVAIEIGNTEWP